MGWSGFWIGLGLAFAVFIYFGYERHWLGLGLTPDLMTIAPHTVEAVGSFITTGEVRRSSTLPVTWSRVTRRGQHLRNRDAVRLLCGPRHLPTPGLVLGDRGRSRHAWSDDRSRGAAHSAFTWIIYVFGAFLIVTGIKMLLLKTDATDPNRNLVVRLTRRLFP